MNAFICPICRKPLELKENSYFCPNNHCFDRSRKGFVNLLLSNKAGHGDDKLMIRARKAFLEKGYYRPLLNVLEKQLLSAAKSKNTILDCGCGECWYTDALYEALKNRGIEADFFGIDVSKDAISAGASRNKELHLAVSTVFDVPLPDKSCDVILSLFAPYAPEEYLRLLKKDGYFITAFPMEEHLWELKQAVYENPYKNTVSDMEMSGFDLIKSDIVHEIIKICTNEDVISLFSMTPYYYKTSAADRAKLNTLNELSVQIHFCVATYKKL